MMGSRIRLGLVSYLNARPIGYGLLEGRQRGRFTILERVPAELAEDLASSALELALIPSIEYARAMQAGRSVAIVPGIAIGAMGPARSVLLFARRSLPDIRSVALDVSSRTSAALLRLLMRRRWRPGLPEPELVPFAPDLPAMLDRCDAALIIGDRALFASRSFPGPGKDDRIFDLGAEWTAMTGLPFVFAFWAGPLRADSAEIVTALQDSLREGLEHIPGIAARASSGSADRLELVQTYLTSSIRYALGHDEIRGLRSFYALLSEEGFLETSPPDLVFHPTAACTRRPS